MLIWLITKIITYKLFGLFTRCKKLNISLVFITQSYFQIQKEDRLNSTYYCIMKIQAEEQKIREFKKLANDLNIELLNESR